MKSSIICLPNDVLRYIFNFVPIYVLVFRLVCKKLYTALKLYNKIYSLRQIIKDNNSKILDLILNANVLSYESIIVACIKLNNNLLDHYIKNPVYTAELKSHRDIFYIQCIKNNNCEMFEKLMRVCYKPRLGYRKFIDVGIQYKSRWFLKFLQRGGLDIIEAIIVRNNVEELEWWIGNSYVRIYYRDYALVLGYKEVADYLSTKFYSTHYNGDNCVGEVGEVGCTGPSAINNRIHYKNKNVNKKEREEIRDKKRKEWTNTRNVQRR